MAGGHGVRHLFLSGCSCHRCAASSPQSSAQPAGSVQSRSSGNTGSLGCPPPARTWGRQVLQVQHESDTAPCAFVPLQ